MTLLQHPQGSPILGPYTLSRVGWLSEQPADFKARLVALGHWKTFRARESLYAYGDAPNGLFGLEEGLLDLSIPISEDEMVILHRASSGFWIGDAALVCGERRGLSVTAYSNCLVFVIPAQALMRHLGERPEDMVYLFRLSYANIMKTLHVLAEVLALPPRARFARMLLRLAPEDDVVRATQTELGALAGMSRAAFRRSFAGLLAAGIVRTEYGCVRILDRARLAAEAERP